MATVQVTCITKPHPSSPHEHITHIGNPPNWVWPVKDVIASIEAKTNSFYVKNPFNGKIAYVMVVPNNGRPYLRTFADGDWNDNLLSLNQCPLR